MSRPRKMLESSNKCWGNNMNPSVCFEMMIAELFRLSDGRTVFVGHVEGETKFIRPCQCELLMDGVRKALVAVEGEMIPEGRHPAGFRSVATRDAIALDTQQVATSDCRLKSISPEEDVSVEQRAGEVLGRR